MAQAIEDRKLEGAGHGQMRPGTSSVRHEGNMKITSYFENLSEGRLSDEEFAVFSKAERDAGGKVSQEEIQRFQRVAAEAEARNRSVHASGQGEAA